MGQRSGSNLHRILSSTSSTSVLLFNAWKRCFISARHPVIHNPCVYCQHSQYSRYLHDEADVGGQGLNSVEAGDERDGEETLCVHLSSEEEVSLQVVKAEVILTGGGRIFLSLQHVIISVKGCELSKFFFLNKSPFCFTNY